MSAEDRDPKFERALAQHFGESSAQAGCPDAETLAAYHERSLSLEEMAQWKQHIAGCAACQEALSLVEVTEKQLAEDWEEKRIPVLEAAAQKSASRSGVAISDVTATAMALPASSAPVSIAQRKRPTLLRWAVPLGAVAAGVLVWIGIHERSTQLAPTQDKIQVAENQPVPSAAETRAGTSSQAMPPAERDREASTILDDLARRDASKPEVKGGARLEQKAIVPAMGDSARKKDEAFNGRTPAPEATIGGIGSGAAPAASAALTAPPQAPPPPAPKVRAKEQAPQITTETVEVTSSAPPVSSAEKPVDLPSGQGAGNGPEDQKHVAALSKSKSPMQQSADINTNAMAMKQGLSGREVYNYSNLAPGVAPAVILTPDHKVWWKLGTGGSVELTTDTGKKWRTVDTGVITQLTAGSAPSSKICWIAGQAGTLLLTTDRGNHWTRVTTPIAGDLGGVHAADAKHATIWDTSNRLSYQTNDGGATWKQTANE